MTKQNVTLIVAASENGVIGCEGELPWHISADLKRFRKLTTGHHIILGRKTFESIGRLLPDRKTIIVTRSKVFFFPGAIIVDSITSALAAAANDNQPFVAGGAEIYKTAIDYVQTIQLTRVHTNIDGDTFLPEINWDLWELVESERYEADKKNEFDYSLQKYQRRKEASVIAIHES